MVEPRSMCQDFARSNSADDDGVGSQGLDFETWVFREFRFLRGNPGLKNETWATHL